MTDRNTTEQIETSGGADVVAVERPLTIHINDRHSFCLMRTPGCEEELALGFVRSKGIITNPGDIKSISYRENGRSGCDAVRIIVNDLVSDAIVSRIVEARSSFDVCREENTLRPPDSRPLFSDNISITRILFASLPEIMRQHQPVFAETGGTHAAGIFDTEGKLIVCREDIGRNNAFDKAIGRLLIAGINSDDKIAVLSSRANLDIVLKAIRAPFPVVGTVSAPTSLAVKTARESGVTLAGFIRGDSIRIYTHPRRIVSL